MRWLHPEWLALLALIPLLWFLPRRVRDVRLGLLRSLVVAALALGLAHPIAVEEGGAEHRVLVVDRSASAARGGGVADGVGAAFAASDGARVSRLDFGDTASSPLAAALETALREIPDGARGSVTLVTDGLATDRRWARATQALGARGIPLHVVPLSGGAPDVRPVRIVVPEPLRVGHTGRVRVEIAADGPAEVAVRLIRGDETVAERDAVRIDGGRARVELRFEPREAGFFAHTAEVRVVSGGNATTANDTLTRTLAVQDPLRVLYLGSRMQGGARRLAELVGPGVDVAVAGETAPDDLRGFDLVVLDDRPADELPVDAQQRIVEAVRDHGAGLFVAGGAASFGPGGYYDSPLESILPVESVQKEEKKDPSTALAVIIDTSGSMGGQRIVLAKEVARLAIRRLLPHDKVGIVEFYGAKRWAAPLQSAANAIDIQRALNRLDAGGGTILMPAIEEAYYGLRNVQTRYKHVLVLTDAGVESGPYEALMRRMARDSICVSTVLVGPERHSEFLVQLADWGNGRYYNASTRFDLPEVMLKQPSTSRLPAYRPGAHALTPRGGRGWWGDVDPTGAPELAGYVETRLRPGADVLIETARDRHPVLATWRWGLGRVTAFTTEPTGPGTRPWSEWEGYGPFLARVLARTASETRHPFAFGIRREDHEVVVSAERRERSDARPAARLEEDGTAEPRALAFVERADGRFEARVVVDPAHAVRVHARADDPARPGEIRLVSDAFADVAAELQVDPRDAFDLARAAGATGGRVVAPGALASFVPPAGGGERSLAAPPLRPWLWAAALLLYLIEIAYRRMPARRVA